MQSSSEIINVENIILSFPEKIQLSLQANTTIQIEKNVTELYPYYSITLIHNNQTTIYPAIRGEIYTAQELYAEQKISKLSSKIIDIQEIMIVCETIEECAQLYTKYKDKTKIHSYKVIFPSILFDHNVEHAENMDNMDTNHNSLSILNRCEENNLLANELQKLNLTDMTLQEEEQINGDSTKIKQFIQSNSYYFQFDSVKPFSDYELNVDIISILQK